MRSIVNRSSRWIWASTLGVALGAVPGAALATEPTTPQAPPEGGVVARTRGMKVVKVRMPDGTWREVSREGVAGEIPDRPMTQAELELAVREAMPGLRSGARIITGEEAARMLEANGRGDLADAARNPQVHEGRVVRSKAYFIGPDGQRREVDPGVVDGWISRVERGEGAAIINEILPGAEGIARGIAEQACRDLVPEGGHMRVVTDPAEAQRLMREIEAGNIEGLLGGLDEETAAQARAAARDGQVRFLAKRVTIGPDGQRQIEDVAPGELGDFQPRVEVRSVPMDDAEVEALIRDLDLDADLERMLDEAVREAFRDMTL